MPRPRVGVGDRLAVAPVARVALALALAGPFATLAARPAAAQPAKVDKKQLAKQYVDSGLAAQNAGDYDTALTFYGKAYEQVPHPILLFNMAQCHRLAGRPAEALPLYRQYLEADPKGPKSKIARELVTALEAQVAEETRKADEARRTDEARKAEELRKADEARKAEELRSAEEARKAQAGAAPGAPGAAGAQPAPDTAAVEGGGRGLRMTGLVAGGLGLAGIGAGIVLDRKARRLSDELSQPGAVYDPKKIDEGEAAERRSHIALAAGGVLVAGGVTLYILGRRQAHPERVALSPLLIPDGIGLAITGGLP